MVERILGEYLFPKGYMMKVIQEFQWWEFRKKENDVTQVIYIKSVGSDYINLYARTSVGVNEQTMSWYIVKNRETLQCRDRILREWNPDNLYSGWKYSTKEEFERILHIFVELTDQYVLDLLVQMSVLDPIHVTTENFLYMQGNLEEIVLKYRKCWELDGKSLDEQTAILSQQLQMEKGKDFHEAERQLANIAAVYGDSLIREFGGRWKWIEYSNVILVKDIGNKDTRCWPLKLMLSVWKGEEKIENDLKRIKKEIAEKPDIPKRSKKWLKLYDK